MSTKQCQLKELYPNSISFFNVSRHTTLAYPFLLNGSKVSTPISHEFSEELSKKIGITNIFNRKIKILKDMSILTMQEILEKYPEYNNKEILELMNMELEIINKMRKIGIKSSQSYGIKVTRKEIFSESQFKSFNHQGDNSYVMIIAFVTFYCLLKIDKPYLKELDEEKIKDILYNSEYFHRIDRDIIDIYLENNEVFDAIVKDHLEGK